VLLAGLYARGVTSVTEPYLSRDHTERMLKYFGVDLDSEGTKIEIEGYPKLTGRTIDIPGDFSSAAFFLVAASILPGSELEILNVGINPTRTGLLDVLTEMGASITLENQRLKNEEPVADIKVKSAGLKGTLVGGELIPRLIDEIPVLAVAAAMADGKTVIRDASELKVKESDRIESVAQELGKMGAKIETLPDGMVIHGTKKLNGAVCQSYGDHRIAMAMCVAGFAARGETRVTGCECINISFPGFMEVFKAL
ncbi:MAG: 3-phosphoshikimate 1-carboxyvinyltransferase, partial [Firmicutes bacterium HGW-Firmicutes-13]